MDPIELYSQDGKQKTYYFGRHWSKKEVYELIEDFKKFPTCSKTVAVLFIKKIKPQL